MRTKKIRLLFLGILVICSNHTYGYDFFIQKVGGAFNGQVKYFTKLTSVSSEGWVLYSIETLDPRTLSFLEHKYFINCRLGKISFIGSSSSQESKTSEVHYEDLKELQDSELSGILGPACKA